MKRVLRWIGYAFAGVAALIVVAIAAVYARSEWILRRTYEFPAVALAIPTDPAAIAEGRRLAITRGCFNGCHGKEAGGVVMIDLPMIARVVAPNLTAAVRKYSNAELVNAIRHGVRPGGRSMAVMPAEQFVLLTDEDLGRIIAFLKSLPAVDGPAPSVSLGPVGRIGIATGRFKNVAQLVAETVPPPAATSEEATYGRYLARTSCPQCHGTSLRGAEFPEFTAPSLQLVVAYSPEQFTELMRTGVPLGGRKLATMGPWARDHLSYFTDAEIAALYSYLHALPDAS